MCRSIKTLFNFDPPATDEEMHAAALQFVRKLSGFNMPSKVNEAAFGDAVDEVFEVARRLINRLEQTPRRATERKKPKRRDSVRPSGLGDQLRLEVSNCDIGNRRRLTSSKSRPVAAAQVSACRLSSAVQRPRHMIGQAFRSRISDSVRAAQRRAISAPRR